MNREIQREAKVLSHNITVHIAAYPRRCAACYAQRPTMLTDRGAMAAAASRGDAALLRSGRPVADLLRTAKGLEGLLDSE